MAHSMKLTPVLLAAVVALQVICHMPSGLLFAAPQAKHQHGFTSRVVRGLEQRTPAAGGRARPSMRRVMTVAQPMAERMEEEPPRHWIWGMLLSCFWPLLCVTFLSDAKMLNAVVQRFPPVVGVAMYVGLATVFWSFARWGLFSRSAKALVQTVCKGLKKLGLTPWRVEVLSKAANPLANVTEGCLVFLAFNFLVNALPSGAVYNLPRIASFIHPGSEGLLAAADIEAFAYSFASRLLIGWIAIQGALFVQAAKEPPTCSIENPTALVAKFLNGLQRLQGMNHKTGQHSVQYSQSQEAMLVQTVDKTISVATWGSVLAIWAALFNVRMSAILAIGGMSGLAISLAASNIVQNLISGLLIFVNRGVVVGDEIEVDGTSGFVDQIRATNTIIYRLDGEPLIVPNSKLVDNSIVNVQRREFWLVEKTYKLSLPKLELLDTVVGKMQEALEKQVAPLQTSPFPGKHHFYQEPLVYVEDLAGGVTVKVRAYVNGSLERHEFYKTRTDIMLALSDAVHSVEGVSFGFEGGPDAGPTQLIIKDA